jgi:glycerol-3-phosphate dehydrogenase
MNHVNKQIAMIGGESWATAFVKILTNNLTNVYWWVRESEIKESIKTDIYFYRLKVLIFQQSKAWRNIL